MKTFLIVAFSLFGILLFAQSRQATNPQIDYDGFLQLTKSANDLRKSRLITLNKFLAMSQKEDVIILDTRSEAAFRQRHIKGAVHLNFSDFSVEKLEKVIPSKDTKILIYCNNNFVGDIQAFMLKSAPLALNIPTFINLHGYGYMNVYELGEQIRLPDPRLEMEGTLTERVIRKSKDIEDLERRWKERKSEND